MNEGKKMESLLELRALTRHYVMKGETIKALDAVDLDVAKGDFLALAGPSGSGKTTLLNLVGALDVPTAGSVRLEGRELSSLSRREQARLRRDRIGFVFQSYNLIPVLSAMENVEYVMLLQGISRRTRRERAAAILSDLGLGDMLTRRPLELSGGQQQRVAVARAIVSEPALVLADEATANLDTAAGEALLETMADINRQRGTTFVFSTHDPLIMERASRLIMLRDGRIESEDRR